MHVPSQVVQTLAPQMDLSQNRAQARRSDAHSDFMWFSLLRSKVSAPGYGFAIPEMKDHFLFKSSDVGIAEILMVAGSNFFPLIRVSWCQHSTVVSHAILIDEMWVRTNLL